MVASTLLNNVEHKDLRVLCRRGVDLGDGVMSTLAFPSEFRALQAHYPIVFQKSERAPGFQPIVLFGFCEGQNLFLGPSGWDAHVLPMAIEREPFMIGVNGEELLVHLDPHSPRLVKQQGDISDQDSEPVFLPYGGASDYLERINSLLLAIHEGMQEVPAFVAALLQHKLLESFVLDFETAAGESSRLAGLYTLNEERLAGLDAKALAQLHQQGYLQAIYMVLASTSNFRDLIERHRRSAGQDF